MKINLDDLVFIGYDVYGYYSGALGVVGVVVEKGDVEKVKDYLPPSLYFYELDGKHSVLEADKGVFEDNDVILEYMYERIYGYNSLVERGLVELEQDLLDKIYELNKSLEKSIVKEYKLNERDG